MLTCDELVFDQACGDPAELFYLHISSSTVLARCRYHRRLTWLPSSDASHITGFRLISEIEYVVRSVMDS